jgi:AcrR family transcriptional regulator
MSPRVADPAVRSALIDAAARLLAEDGPAALSTRRLAAEVGTSTMTIYTHFGSMSELHAEVRREGFSRLAAAIRSASESVGPVATLVVSGVAYLRAALAAPELYRAMFNHQPPPGDDAGREVFELLTERVRRCVGHGSFPDADPSRCAVWAGEFWAASHGAATLALSGILPEEQVTHLLTDMTYRLAVGFGDAPDSARRSVDAALPAVEDRSAAPSH